MQKTNWGTQKAKSEYENESEIAPHLKGKLI